MPVLEISRDPFTLGGKTMESFSVAHLLAQNVYATLPVDRLVARMFEDGAEAAECQRKADLPVQGDPTVEALARRVALRYGLEVKPAVDAKDAARLDALDDRDLILIAAQQGNMRGLGSAWGFSADAEMLWAAAAALLRHHGVEHPNDVPLHPSRSDGTAPGPSNA